MKTTQKIAKLIRLAYRNPELRPKLLPTLIQANRLLASKKDPGVGPYKSGKKIRSLKELKEGDLLISQAFAGMKTLARVTDVGDDSFQLLFVDPKDPREKRRPSDRPIKVKESQLAKGQLSMAKKAMVLQVGRSVEDERRMLRFQRFRDTLKVWDLTNAGKRGKKVKIFAVTGLDRTEGAAEMVHQVTSSSNFNEALKKAKEWVDAVSENSSFVRFYETEERGVDVTPAGFRPITVEGKYVFIEAEYNTFRVKDRVDLANEPTCIPAIKGGKKDIKVFYRWVKDNQSKLKSMKFNEVLRSMMSEGIKYHQYCAMD